MGAAGWAGSILMYCLMYSRHSTVRSLSSWPASGFIFSLAAGQALSCSPDLSQLVSYHVLGSSDRQVAFSNCYFVLLGTLHCDLQVSDRCRLPGCKGQALVWSIPVLSLRPDTAMRYAPFSTLSHEPLMLSFNKEHKPCLEMNVQ